MREIKFRVWDTRYKKWFDARDRCCHISYTTENFGLNKQLIFQQSTSLKDHKGKEIYEGDIIFLAFSMGHERDSSQDYYGNYEVQFKNGQWKLIKLGLVDKEDFHNELELWLESSDYLQNKGMKDFEVVGNIFENPELCEK